MSFFGTTSRPKSLSRRPHALSILYPQDRFCLARDDTRQKEPLIGVDDIRRYRYGLWTGGSRRQNGNANQSLNPF
jgi:hypothetical protein